ncbi:MAG TPA: glutaredoxin family protein [Terrimesophilobacter sp.]|uniref:glutaredoxin family protein n=1 Tax=Terrimesophilobacter sp. TaxID=2906435 RepID=UPI002F92305E
MPHVRLTIIGKPECHLCDVAEEVIDGVVRELRSTASDRQVTVEKLSILDDPELYERYWEQIPVVLINDTEHAHWRVDPEALRAAIQ